VHFVGFLLIYIRKCTVKHALSFILILITARSTCSRATRVKWHSFNWWAHPLSFYGGLKCVTVFKRISHRAISCPSWILSNYSHIILISKKILFFMYSTKCMLRVLPNTCNSICLPFNAQRLQCVFWGSTFQLFVFCYTACLYVQYEGHNKQLLLPCTSLTDWSL
jgi:hypothetical protein